MDKQKCEHKTWKHAGMWDGENASGQPNGGPIIACVECGLEKNVTYEEWAKIQKEADFDYKRANNKFNKPKN